MVTGEREDKGLIWVEYPRLSSEHSEWIKITSERIACEDGKTLLTKTNPTKKARFDKVTKYADVMRKA